MYSACNFLKSRHKMTLIDMLLKSIWHKITLPNKG